MGLNGQSTVEKDPRANGVKLKKEEFNKKPFFIAFFVGIDKVGGKSRSSAKYSLLAETLKANEPDKARNSHPTTIGKRINVRIIKNILHLRSCIVICLHCRFKWLILR